ncbi:MAG TPA: universal stress protein [Candidatus Acidoferrales bacterium]|nr:universal stress protein [Candidatus Acidoferrales bacterium]
MFSKMLIAIDGSSRADRALQTSVEWAKSQRSALEICKVVDPVDVLGEGTLDDAQGARLARATAEAERLVANAVDTAKVAGISARGSVAVGDPANEIAALAATAGADAVVVGSHGRAGHRRFSLGSVAERLLRIAPCPVVVLPAAPECYVRTRIPHADRRSPVFAVRMMETSPDRFERLYGEIATFMDGPGADLRGCLGSQLFGSDDRTRILIVAEFESHDAWSRAQWDARLGTLLEELALSAETLDFNLYRGDRFAAGPPTAVRSV